MKELPAILSDLAAAPRTPRALATLVTVEGSSYRRAGARLLVGRNGHRIGSISGGCLEADVIEHAHRVMDDGVARTLLYDTTEENDLVWGVGLGCHGIVRVLIERLPEEPAWARLMRENFRLRRETRLRVAWGGPDPSALGTREALAGEHASESEPGVLIQGVPPPIRLHLFGAGDDAQPLARLADHLGWIVHVYDPRPQLALSERFPTAASVRSVPPEAAAEVPIDDRTLAVIMTHHYVHDVPLLRALLPRALRYVGLLGPRRRAERMLDELADAGLEITPGMRDRLHAPIGLDLGGDAPEAVALSILAEMQAVLTGRDSRPLRERTRPIHA